MLLEGFVSIMALVAAGILIPGDYFAINSMLGADQLTALGFAPERIQELSQMVGTNVANRPGGAVSLAVGMASVFSTLPGMKHLMAYWYNFALMFEALFILTTVDTGTRVARFLLQEMGGYAYKPLGRHAWLPGTLLTSFLVVAAWGGLIYSGSISTIWPMFGVANQLLAAVALAVGTTVLIKLGKARYTPITIVPMLFMFTTTLTASYQLDRAVLAASRNGTRQRPDLPARRHPRRRDGLPGRRHPHRLARQVAHVPAGQGRRCRAGWGRDRSRVLTAFQRPAIPRRAETFHISP